MLVLYLSLYWAVFSCVAARLGFGRSLMTTMALSSLWVGLEYLRTYFLSGFPWELMGYSQHSNLLLVQIADITGVYGISFLLVLVNCVVAIWWRRIAKREPLPWAVAFLAVTLVGASYGYGYWRVHTPMPTETDLRVGAAQGNIDQSVKWERSFQTSTLEIYRTLTFSMSNFKPDLVVWPETAVPAYFPAGTDLDEKIMAVPREFGAYLLFGSLGLRPGDKEPQVTNSAYLVSPTPDVADRYDKMHLVPFGEYVPLGHLFPFVGAMTGVGNLAAGKEGVLFSLPQSKFGVVICFEVIFPDLFRRFVKYGADFMVTITNDAWFGRTSAPYQHFIQAAFRCIENRVWLVRAANTGISGFVDPYGRIRAQTPIFERATVTHMISVCRDDETFYTRHGDLCAMGCSVLGILTVGAVLLRRRL